MSDTETPAPDATSDDGSSIPVDTQPGVDTEAVPSQVTELPVQQGPSPTEATFASPSASAGSDPGNDQDEEVENEPSTSGGTQPGVDAEGVQPQPTGSPLDTDSKEATLSASPSLTVKDTEAKNRYDSEPIQMFLLDKSAPEDEGDTTLSERLKEMEKEHIGAPYRGEYGQTSLHIAAERGLLESARTLLYAGASLSAVDDEGCPPLHLACREGHVRIVALFLCPPADISRADINAKDLRGCVPLHEACWNGHEAVMNLLLEKGANIHLTDENGWSPLHSASYHGHTDMIRSLLEKNKTNIDNGSLLEENKTYIDDANVHGDTAMHMAANDGAEDAVRLLLSHGSKAHLTVDGRTWYPLHCAAQSGHGDIVKLLLDEGAGNNIKDDEQTPLLLAARGSHTDTMSILLKHKSEEKNPQLEVADEDGLTPLYITAIEGSEAGFDLLLKAKADYNTRSKTKKTVLMGACRWRNRGIVKKFLESESVTPKNIDAQDEDGNTALHRASYWGHLNIAKLLLKHNAKADIENNERQTALHLASRQGYENLVNLLISAEATASVDKKKDVEDKTALHYASLASSKDLDLQDPGDLGPEGDGSDEEPDDGEKKKSDPGRHDAVVKLLLEKGANPEAKTKKKETALHLAARHSDCARVESILKKMKGEVNAQDDDGKTALDVAFDERERDERKPDERQPDEGGDTVMCLLSTGNITFSQTKIDDFLAWAAENEKRHEIARLFFLKSPAEKPKHPGSHEWSAIEWAAYMVKPTVLWLLLSNSKPTPETDRRRRSALELVGDVPASRWKISPAGKRGDEASKLPASKSKNSRAGTRGDETKNPEPEARAAKERVKGGSRDKAKGTVKDKDKQTIQDKDKQTVQDILRDPPPTLTSKPREPFVMPEIANIPPQTERFNAGIVQFYERDGESGFFRRLRTVEKVIYSPGLKRVKEEMTETLEEIIGTTTDGPSELQKMYIHGKPKFTWVHLPATNIVWMNDLLKRIMLDEEGEEESKKKEFYNVSSFLRDSWFEIPDRTSPSRIMRPRYVSNKTESEKTGERVISALYMPYLSFSMQCRDGEDLAKFNKKYPPNEDEKESLKSLQDAKEAYHGLLEDYEDKVIHGSPTLDEAYYHFAGDPASAKDQQHRNETQVVTKSMVSDVARHSRWPVPRVNEAQDVEKHSHWPVLRVNQLWLWTIGDGWLITSSSHPVDSVKDTLTTGILNHLSKQAEVGERQSQPHNPDEMSKVIVDYCIGLYERAQPSQKGKLGEKGQPGEKSQVGEKGQPGEKHQPGEKGQLGKKGQPGNKAQDGKDNQSIRQIFSDSINRIGMDEAKLFEDFEDTSLLKGNDKNQARKARSQMGGRQDTDINAALKKAVTLSCRIKDIRDELNILKTVAQHQMTVQKGMVAQHQMTVQEEMPVSWSTPAETTAAYIVADITKMELMGNRIQEAATTTLSLVQNQIANAQAQEAVSQGRTLMIFTVATILFLPLSFLSSLFAVDVASFQQAPGWAFSVIFSVSLVLFAPLAFYALYPDEFVQFFVQFFLKEKTPGYSSGRLETDSRTNLPATGTGGKVDNKDIPQGQDTTESDVVESPISNNHWTRNIPGWLRRRLRSRKSPEDDSKA